MELVSNKACGEELETRVHREWLLTNGRGGYAMGTEPGVNTRRYHGLLVGAMRPPVGRVVGLHSMIEWLEMGGERIDLSTQQFLRGDPPAESFQFHPEGWRYFQEMRRENPGQVSWVWNIGGVEIEKTLNMEGGENGVTIAYEIRGMQEPGVLWLRPLTPLRDFHELDGDGKVVYRKEAVEGNEGSEVRVGRDDLELLMTGSAGCGWQEEPQWWKNFAYAEERARGQAWREDVYSPGAWKVELGAETEHRVSIRATLCVRHDLSRASGRGTECSEQAISLSPGHTAADQFVAKRWVGDAWKTTIVAGWPWFADWGRDAMISIPGLLLVQGRHREAREVLELFGSRVQEGLIPNRFDDYGGDAHYNTVDASLWFLHAVWAYGQANPEDDIRGLVEVGQGIVRAYRAGTRFGIGVDGDGLVFAGDATTQLTWMDAQRNGVVFTPRHGKAVEINALWYHGLCCLAEMVENIEEATEFQEQAERCAASFREQFWCDEKGCCFDVLVPNSGQHADGGYVPDGRIRPNQIFAVSLPHSPLMKDQQRGVVEVVRDRLLTPYGLRTLDPEDSAYRGRYAGDMVERDGAYHNGTVWPWLIGPYGEAVLRVNDYSEEAKTEVREVLGPLQEVLAREGRLAEVYDGDSPQEAGGCMAQAWSVAEVLRLARLVK